MSYKKRLSDPVLQFKLECRGAVLIEGAKWCGKTTTAKHHAASFISMAAPDQGALNLQLAKIRPSQLLAGATPRLIDEWQLAPRLWDAVRYEVDERGKEGQFILTGSAVPIDPSQLLHTGTGRITRMRMRPMSLYESGESNGQVSLRALFEGAKDITGDSAFFDTEHLAFLICRGGWPAAIDKPQHVALEQARDYYAGVVHFDLSRASERKKNRKVTERVLRSYARLTGGQRNLTTMLKDVQGRDVLALSDDTLRSYLQALENIFVIEESPAWNPNFRSRTAIRQSPTLYFTDPSIGAAALRLSPADLIKDLNTMGLFFENLCVRDLRIFADVMNGEVYHYRDKNGLECDAVVHCNGKYGLVEIKLGGAPAIEEAAKTLNKLAAKIDTTKMPEPAFKMVLVGICPYAYQREDGVLVVPIDCLKD